MPALRENVRLRDAEVARDRLYYFLDAHLPGLAAALEQVAYDILSNFARDRRVQILPMRMQPGGGALEFAAVFRKTLGKQLDNLARDFERGIELPLFLNTALKYLQAQIIVRWREFSDKAALQA